MEAGADVAQEREREEKEAFMARLRAQAKAHPNPPRETRSQALTVGACRRCRGAGYILGAGGPGRAWIMARTCPCRDVCPNCLGAGHTLREMPGLAAVFEACVCSHEALCLTRLNNGHLPWRYLHATLETFEPHTLQDGLALKSAALTYVEQYAAGASGWLMIGPPGTGKTHLCVALLRALALERATEIRFLDFSELIADVRRHRREHRLEPYLAMLAEFPVLALDELGAGSTEGDYVVAFCDELVGLRSEKRHTTLYTTNYPVSYEDARALPVDAPPPPRGVRARSYPIGMERLPLLYERLSARLVDRVLRKARLIEFEGPDRRRELRLRDPFHPRHGR